MGIGGQHFAAIFIVSALGRTHRLSTLGPGKEPREVWIHLYPTGISAWSLAHHSFIPSITSLSSIYFTHTSDISRLSSATTQCTTPFNPTLLPSDHLSVRFSESFVLIRLAAITA